MTDQPILLETALVDYLRSLEGNNKSRATIVAYRTDIGQFLHWLHATNLVPVSPAQVEKRDITEYVASLAKRELKGVSRARKVVAIREYFRFCEEQDYIAKSPAAHVPLPKQEKHNRTYLVQAEYTKLLSLAGGSPRDYAIFQVFLQTGVRVSELCNLRLADIDLANRSLLVTAGKGQVARSIALEKKGVQAVKSYLAVRPSVFDDHLFLNRDNEPFSQRGLRKLVARYLKAAGITKKASCHSLRHTFATYKAEHGVSPFQLREWLGHQSLETTQIYVHIGRQNAQKAMEQTSL